MWGRQEEEYEPSAFTSNGKAEFPPIYEDSKKLSELSTWRTSVLQGRLVRYLAFLDDNPMPRAKDGAQRIVEHIDFELQYRAMNPDWNEGLDYE